MDAVYSSLLKGERGGMKRQHALTGPLAELEASQQQQRKSQQQLTQPSAPPTSPVESAFGVFIAPSISPTTTTSKE